MLPTNLKALSKKFQRPDTDKKAQYYEIHNGELLLSTGSVHLSVSNVSRQQAGIYSLNDDKPTSGYTVAPAYADFGQLKNKLEPSLRIRQTELKYVNSLLTAWQSWGDYAEGQEGEEKPDLGMVEFGIGSGLDSGLKFYAPDYKLVLDAIVHVQYFDGNILRIPAADALLLFPSLQSLGCGTVDIFKIAEDPEDFMPEILVFAKHGAHSILAYANINVESEKAEWVDAKNKTIAMFPGSSESAVAVGR